MIVLDASAVVDVVVGQPPARWILDRIEGEDLVAPSHQPAEVLSALVRLERAGALDAAGAADALAAASTLPQDLVPLTAGLLRRAFELRDRIRVVDGLYVALANERDVALLTTDRRLVRAEPPCGVLSPPAAGDA